MSATNPLAVSETRADLPEGWELVAAGDALNLINGFPFKPTQWKRNGRPIIRIQNLNNPEAAFNYCTDPISEKFAVRNGNLLFAWSGTPGTSFGAHIWNGDEAWLNQHIFRVEFDESIFDKRFLRFSINRNLDEYISQAQGGVGLAHITKRKFESILITLPPIAEQKQIVEKVEQLLARVNAARERLARVPTILKRFRQAVLAAACSGKLTADWRDDKRNVQSVQETVEAIRIRQMAAAVSDAQRESLKEIYDYSEDSDASDLPENWRFVALNKLCESFNYGTSAKSETSGRIPVLRMGNIQNGQIDWSNLAFTSDRDEIARYSLKPNTVLFNRTNSPELVGKTAIYRGERPAIFAGYLIRIVHVPELDPNYLNLCLNTPYARAFCSQVKTDGVSQSNINAQKLGLFEVPYCPFAEQNEIVRRVEALFKLADAIEKRVATATARADKLTQAILAKAFRGELVPTEAELARREGRSYEPASALLARIRHDPDQPREISRKAARQEHRRWPKKTAKRTSGR